MATIPILLVLLPMLLFPVCVFSSLSDGTVADPRLSLTKSRTAVKADLWTKYQKPPSAQNKRKILSDFSFSWVDGNTGDEKWSTYNEWLFDQQSEDPSKIVAVSRLIILKDQRFKKPLPLSGSRKFYDRLKSSSSTLKLRLNCDPNFGGNNHAINLNRSLSVWDLRGSGQCKIPLPHHTVAPYIHSLYLLVHEGRHNEPGDPGHVTCKRWTSPNDPEVDNMDRFFENGSGHAFAALYLMWVYKYGSLDPVWIREEAKGIAIGLLKTRFCNRPTHSNRDVQALIDELLF